MGPRFQPKSFTVAGKIVNEILDLRVPQGEMVET